jgi:hypothetical protein
MPLSGDPFPRPHRGGQGTMDDAVVESARGAVAALLPLRFPGPLAEPGVRVSRLCRHSVEYAEARIMPSRWSLRLVRWLSGGVFFGII